MIDRAEIDDAAERLGVTPANVQRDYVHSWLLGELFGGSTLAGRMVLKGGSCLRKCYYEAARFSPDLDLSTADRISDDELRAELQAAADRAGSASGVEFDLARTDVRDKQVADKQKQVAEVRVYFRDFYGKPGAVVLKVQVDVTQFDRIHLPVQERRLIHPYSDRDGCDYGVRCVKLEELLGTKMRCLLQRRHVADLFDLAYSTFINRDIEVDRGEVLHVFLRSTIFNASRGVAKGLFLDLPLEGMRRFWERFIACPVQSLFPFDDALAALRELVDALFPESAIAARSDVLFPAAMRNPILEAGDTQCLLRLRYKGIDRLVEPYSLKYKTRKDGAGREYFYGFDQTRDQTIKSFVPSNVDSVEVTDESFVPRFDIELAQAGGAETAGRFRWRRGRRVSRAIRGHEFEVECTWCHRRFKRRRHSSRLRPHKDSFGNPCHGRTGFRV